MLHVIHFSDTHLGATPEFSVREVTPYKRTLKLIGSINQLDFKPDLIVHTGDVTNDPLAEAYQLAVECFSSLKAPIYFATGNHDDAQLIKQHLPVSPHTRLVDDPDRLAYHWDMGHLRFYCLDAKVPEEEGPHGEIPQNQLDALREDIASHDLPYAVFLHFPPFRMGSIWMDKKLILTNGPALHQILKDSSPDRYRIRGVFFGHTHRSIQLYREGILYSGVASPAFQFSMTPEDGPPSIDASSPLVFNHITFLPNSTAIKEYTISP
ncbi:MAG: metallophosphoesterase [Verrucomicrobiota bacterium]